MKQRDNEESLSNEFKGSRLRCLRITNLNTELLRDFLECLVTPHATLPDGFQCKPKGFMAPEESVLGEREGFLPEFEAQFSQLKKWWLARPARNLPNWDLVSSCRIGDRSGLILVEAKAHEGEFDNISDRCKATGVNGIRIPEAIGEASAALNREKPGFHLSSEKHYQLSNRFAISWKLATLGIPVILVYLGFIDADEMLDVKPASKLFRDGAEWEKCVKNAKSHVPEGAWDHPFCEGNFIPLIRSARVKASGQPELL